MHQLNNTVFLNHSKVLFIPVVGSIFYKTQLFLNKLKVTNSFYVSRRYNKERQKLIKEISKNSKYLILKSPLFHLEILNEIKCKIIADFELESRPKKMSTERLHTLYWNILFVNSVTFKTKKNCADFIPENVPVINLSKIDLLNKNTLP